MKKLITLISILFLISIVSSAQNTQDTTKKKVIKLPESVAKEVVKDLLRADSAIEELKLNKQLYREEVKKSNAKDGIIANLNQQIGVFKLKVDNYENMLSEKDNIIAIESYTAAQLAKDLKKEKRKNARGKIFGGAIIIALGALLIAK